MVERAFKFGQCPKANREKWIIIHTILKKEVIKILKQPFYVVVQKNILKKMRIQLITTIIADLFNVLQTIIESLLQFIANYATTLANLANQSNPFLNKVIIHVCSNHCNFNQLKYIAKVLLCLFKFPILIGNQIQRKSEIRYKQI